MFLSLLYLFPFEWMVYLDHFLFSHGITFYGEHEFGDERTYDFVIDLCLLCSAVISFPLAFFTYRLITRNL